MANAAFILQDLDDRYAALGASPAYTRLYERADPRVAKMLANLHERLNSLFDFANEKMDRGRHFNAGESRELNDLIREIGEQRRILSGIGIDVELSEQYRAVLDEFRTFLQLSGGTPMPDEFGPITVERYEPVFTVGEITVRLQERGSSFDLKMVGHGSFAIVYKFKDADLGKTFGVKAAKRGLEAKELKRFKREYKIMRDLSFPYVLEVYNFDAAKNRYIMEFCDGSLRSYIEKNNAKLPFATRKRIALQFLYGLNYIHLRGLLHRDLSGNNVLVKQYDAKAVVIKLCDFGLVKDRTSELTSTGSSLKGTYIDPALADFRSYNVRNEIWAVGVVLSLIFSGSAGLRSCTGEVLAIVERCTMSNPVDRYESVVHIAADVEALAIDASSSQATP